MAVRYFRLLSLLLLPLFLLSACGEDDAPAHRVEVTVALQGNATDTVQAVDLTLALPSGFTIVADSNGEPAAGTVTSLLGSALVAAKYLPTGSNSGGPALHVVIADATGFAANAALVKVVAIYPPDSLLPTSTFFAGTADVTTIDSSNSSNTTLGTLVAVSVATIKL